MRVTRLVSWLLILATTYVAVLLLWLHAATAEPMYLFGFCGALTMLWFPAILIGSRFARVFEGVAVVASVGSLAIGFSLAGGVALMAGEELLALLLGVTIAITILARALYFWRRSSGTSSS